MPHQPANEFIKYLTEDVGFILRRTAHLDGEFDIFYLDLTALKLGLDSDVPFIVPQAPGDAQVEGIANLVARIEDVTRDLAGRVRVVVIEAEISEPIGLFSQLSEQLIAIIDTGVLTSLRNAGTLLDKRRIFVASLVRCVGRFALSPYILGSPAYGSRFFGRERDLKMIGTSSRGNYVIVGPRRIGKTSLMSEVRNRLRNKESSILTADVYGGSCSTTEDFLITALEALNASFPLPAAKKDLIRSFLNYLKREPRLIVLFVDELDPIIEWDSKQGFELLEIVRAAFSGDNRRIFFAGFRRTIAAQHNVHSPLFNLGAQIFLGSLAADEAMKMVEQPLELLGIKVPGDVTATVIANTNGRPELVQYCCIELLSIFEREGALPDALKFHAMLRSSGAFMRRIVHTFIASANPHEELLCRLMARRSLDESANTSAFSFTIEDAHHELLSAGVRLSPSDVSALSVQLEFLGAIEAVNQDTFRFVTDILPEALWRDSFGVERLVKELAGEQENRSVSSALRSESPKYTVFVSYTQTDLEWAQWIAWTLENLGHSVVLQAWDFVPGSNFVQQMHRASKEADRLVLVLSEAYLESRFAGSEWAAMFRTDPSGVERRIVPVRVRMCDPEGLLGSIVYLDLVGRNELEAAELLVSLFEPRQKPSFKPQYPSLHFPGK